MTSLLPRRRVPKLQQYGPREIARSARRPAIHNSSASRIRAALPTSRMMAAVARARAKEKAKEKVNSHVTTSISTTLVLEQQTVSSIMLPYLRLKRKSVRNRCQYHLGHHLKHKGKGKDKLKKVAVASCSTTRAHVHVKIVSFPT